MTGILRSEMRDALSRAGYLLESRIDRVLREREQGYFVETNTPFLDIESGKTREIDLHAMTAWKAGPAEFDFVFARLLIECVNNPQPLALITKEPVLHQLNAEHVKLAGIPTMVSEGKARWTSMRDYLGLENYHHYCRDRIATQYCSFQRKRGQHEWMAFHDEAHFGLFKALTDSVEYEISAYYGSWRSGDAEEPVNLEFYYPVVVVEGSLVEVQPTQRGMRISERNHLMYQRSVIRGSTSDEYQIDVVTESAFSDLLATIESEMAKTSRLLRRRHQKIREVVNSLSLKVKRLRSPTKIRNELSFDG